MTRTIALPDTDAASRRSFIGRLVDVHGATCVSLQKEGLPLIAMTDATNDDVLFARWVVLTCPDEIGWPSQRRKV